VGVNRPGPMTIVTTMPGTVAAGGGLSVCRDLVTAGRRRGISRIDRARHRGKRRLRVGSLTIEWWRRWLVAGATGREVGMVVRVQRGVRPNRWRRNWRIYYRGRCISSIGRVPRGSPRGFMLAIILCHTMWLCSCWLSRVSVRGRSRWTVVLRRTMSIFLWVVGPILGSGRRRKVRLSLSRLRHVSWITVLSVQIAAVSIMSSSA